MGTRPELELVGLHGFAGSGALLRRLDSTVGWWTPDLVGHGRSAALRMPGFDAEVERLERLRCRRPRRTRVLVGYSLGARVGLRWACRFPEAFAALVLVGVAPGLVDAQARAARVTEDAAWVAVLREKGIAAFAHRWEALPLFAGQRRASPASRRWQRQIRRRQDPAGLAHCLEVLGLGAMPPVTAEDCRRLTVPVVLVAGAEDAKFVALARELAQRLAQARLVVVPNCGHNVALEAPAALAGVIRNVTAEVERWRQ